MLCPKCNKDCLRHYIPNEYKDKTLVRIKGIPYIRIICSTLLRCVACYTVYNITPVGFEEVTLLRSGNQAAG